MLMNDVAKLMKALTLMREGKFACRGADWERDAAWEARRLYYKARQYGIEDKLAKDYAVWMAESFGKTIDVRELYLDRERYVTADLSRVDLRRWLDFDKFTNAGRNEYHGPCPKCGGEDRFALQERVGRQYVGCRVCIGLERGQWMDGIAFIQWLYDCDFVRACETLALGKVREPADGLAMPTREDLPAEDRQAEADWGPEAMELVNGCAANLSAEHIAYLRTRGIFEDVARAAKLGTSRGGKWKGLYIPAGLVIPCLIDGKPRYIKVRTVKGYRQVGGGKQGLYAVGDCTARPAIVTETELDALMLAARAESLGLPIAVYATGSTEWNLDRRAELIDRHALYTAFDNDDAGRKATRRWRVPPLSYVGYDVGDLYDGAWHAVDALIAQVIVMPRRPPQVPDLDADVGEPPPPDEWIGEPPPPDEWIGEPPPPDVDADVGGERLGGSDGLTSGWRAHFGMRDLDAGYEVGGQVASYGRAMPRRKGWDAWLTKSRSLAVNYWMAEAADKERARRAWESCQADRPRACPDMKAAVQAEADSPDYVCVDGKMQNRAMLSYLRAPAGQTECIRAPVCDL